MKKNHIYSTIILLFLSMNQLYSQVEISIIDTFYNNNSSSTGCEELDFGITQNNTVSVNFKITKPTAQVLSGSLVLYLSSPNVVGFTSLGSTYVFNNSWSNGSNSSEEQFVAVIPGNISASQISTNDSYLFVRLESSSGLLYDSSCNIPLTKTPVPEFRISPAQTNVVCNVATAKIFSVKNVNGSQGSIQYTWNVGSGWRQNGFPAPATITTTTNFLTLTPSIYPPGNVSATARLNGANYPAGTSTVSLAQFNTGATITGSGTLCQPTTYSVTSMLTAGVSVQQWFTSDPTVATAVADQSNPNMATVTPSNKNDEIFLYARLVNACGQTETIQLRLVVGKPKYEGGMYISGSENEPVNGQSQLNLTNFKQQTYRWWIVKLNDQCRDANGFYPAGTRFPKFDTGNGTFASQIITTTPYVFVDWGNCKGNYAVNVSATNSCGETGLDYLSVNVYNPYNGDPCPQKLVASPNPSKNGEITVQRIPANPCDNIPTLPRISYIDSSMEGKIEEMAIKNKDAVVNNKVEILDLNGLVIFSKTFKTDTFEIKGLDGLVGTYILKVKPIDGELLTKMLILE